ncbi:hypothetical protein KX928_21265 [Roseobacter sp. YSTF-M11]|uniref:Uncharacterized protein n=1 Tax=Roseobacter insulae TaxID=2859783 RepID=A0A9X1FZN1_9RHOB|nr:hypothetical protein [Roseobacter insulae]MBW4710327.1 hypothetical protein [Roseobacter insulae]
MSVFAHVSSLIVAAVAGPVLALLSSPPTPGDVALVIAPPWAEREQIVTRAGGRVVGPATAIFGTLAISADPDFKSALLSEGAWVIVDGRSVAYLCGVTS